MRSAIFGIAVVFATGSASAEGVAVDSERRDLFVSVLEVNGCRMHNIYPSEGIMKAISENEFDRDEVRAIGRDLLERGVAQKDGDFLLLKTGACK